MQLFVRSEHGSNNNLHVGKLITLFSFDFVFEKDFLIFRSERASDSTAFFGYLKRCASVRKISFFQRVKKHLKCFRFFLTR